ncbi:hypothetical protein SANA_27670 [Gottschalkiaceae bacterium SANA]|nr:hypothetical protein SANA_27670 [Gottschalkiaceae bacterium SANA]
MISLAQKGRAFFNGRAKPPCKWGILVKTDRIRRRKKERVDALEAIDWRKENDSKKIRESSPKYLAVPSNLFDFFLAWGAFSHSD